MRTRSFVGAALLGATVAAGGACTRREASVEAERPRTTASATATATASASATATTTASATASATAIASATATSPKVAAWTDPEVVAELTKRCTWMPAKTKEGEDENPLFCEANSFDQSCVYDPCFHGVRTKCREQCLKTCSSCGAPCAAKCDACKAGCKDDACRAECAKTCGACRQACLVVKDQCMTATCTRVYDQCSADMRAQFKKSGCDKMCAKFEKCRGACYDKPIDPYPCIDACTKSVAAVCTRDLLAMCDLVGDSP